MTERDREGDMATPEEREEEEKSLQRSIDVDHQFPRLMVDRVVVFHPETLPRKCYFYVQGLGIFVNSVHTEEYGVYKRQRPDGSVVFTGDWHGDCFPGQLARATVDYRAPREGELELWVRLAFPWITEADVVASLKGAVPPWMRIIPAWDDPPEFELCSTVVVRESLRKKYQLWVKNGKK